MSQISCIVCGEQNIENTVEFLLFRMSLWPCTVCVQVVTGVRSENQRYKANRGKGCLLNMSGLQSKSIVSMKE